MTTLFAPSWLLGPPVLDSSLPKLTHRMPDHPETQRSQGSKVCQALLYSYQGSSNLMVLTFSGTNMRLASVLAQYIHEACRHQNRKRWNSWIPCFCFLILIPLPSLPLSARKPKPPDTYPSWAGWCHLMTHICLKQAFALGTRPELLLSLPCWAATHPQRQRVLDTGSAAGSSSPWGFAGRGRDGQVAAPVSSCTAAQRPAALPGAKAPYLLKTCWAVSDICPWCICHENWCPEHQMRQLFLSPRRGFMVLTQQLHHGDFGSPGDDHTGGCKDG